MPCKTKNAETQSPLALGRVVCYEAVGHLMMVMILNIIMIVTMIIMMTILMMKMNHHDCGKRATSDILTDHYSE